jgi:hypothetical protein
MLPTWRTRGLWAGSIDKSGTRRVYGMGRPQRPRRAREWSAQNETCDDQGRDRLECIFGERRDHKHRNDPGTENYPLAIMKMMASSDLPQHAGIWPIRRIPHAGPAAPLGNRVSRRMLLCKRRSLRDCGGPGAQLSCGPSYFGVRSHDVCKSDSARISCNEQRTRGTHSSAKSSRVGYKSSERVVRRRGSRSNSTR